jgi:hypothetical protein
MASQREVAEHLGVTPRRVRQLVDEGAIPAPVKRVYDLDACRLACLRRLREQAAGRMGRDGAADLIDERALLARKQRERLEFDLAIKRGKYCEVEITGQLVEGAFAVVREIALGLPGTYADQLAMKSRAECFEILQLAINAMLTSLCDGADEEIVRRAAEEATG